MILRWKQKLSSPKDMPPAQPNVLLYTVSQAYTELTSNYFLIN